MVSAWEAKDARRQANRSDSSIDPRTKQVGGQTLGTTGKWVPCVNIYWRETRVVLLYKVVEL